MPIRPFPLPLSVGTDICSIQRVHQLIQGGKREALMPFLRRILTSREQELFFERFKSQDVVSQSIGFHDSTVQSVVKHLAGRWAAKEAVIKAYGFQGRRLTFGDIILTPMKADKADRSQPVTCIVLDKCETIDRAQGCKPAEERDDNADSFKQDKKDPDQYQHDASTRDDQSLENLKGQVVRISISHDEDYATAVCIAPLESIPGDVGGEAAGRDLF